MSTIRKMGVDLLAHFGVTICAMTLLTIVEQVAYLFLPILQKLQPTITALVIVTSLEIASVITRHRRRSAGEFLLTLLLLSWVEFFISR